MVNVLSAILILAVLQPGGVLYVCFHNAALRWLGRISYGAYVWHNIVHDPIGHWAEAHYAAHAQLATGLFGAVVTLVVSVVSYRYFERPFLSLKDRFTLRS